jgi:signal peptidase
VATRERARHPVKDVVLTLAGAAGVLSLLWFAIATTTGLSIMIVTTGSMSPTIPAGSAALVRPVAASAISVGDVVTVQRAGARLPVTHRVVSVEPDPDAAAGRILVLRGDANATDDPFPYHVTAAKSVVASVPVLGTAIALGRQPLVLGLTTLGVAALIVWAFWPERRAAHRLQMGVGA